LITADQIIVCQYLLNPAEGQISRPGLHK
jgi:hypothetical protein